MSIDNRENKLARYLLFLGSGQVNSTGFSIEIVAVFEITEGNLKEVFKERGFGKIETVMRKALTHAEEKWIKKEHTQAMKTLSF